MDWFELLLLPLIQGIAEFLPISSSGHLVIAEALGGRPPNATYNVLLHGGTLASILVYYRKRIVELVSQDRRVLPLLVLGTVPAAVVGVTIKLSADEILENPLLAGLMLPITGAIVWWSNRRPEGDHAYRELTAKQTLIIGSLQAFALLPGLSRSGLTIAAGLGVGLRRDQATSFSFLLAIPAILGAMVLEARSLLNGEGDPLTSSQIVGTLLAAVIGVAALAWLTHWVSQRRLHWFAFWCIPFGCLVILWQLAQLATNG